jgi:hypothetical protein
MEIQSFRAFLNVSEKQNTNKNDILGSKHLSLILKKRVVYAR